MDGTNPTVAAKIVRVGVMAIVVAAVGGNMYSRLLPSAFAQELAISGGMACAILGLWGAIRSGSFNPENDFFRSSPLPRWLRSTAVKFFVVMLVGAVLPYHAFLFGFPTVYTIKFGTPAQEVLTVSGTSSGGRGGHCGHYEVREYPYLAAGALCASWENLQSAQIGSHLLVKGSRSVFGLEVDSISVL